MKPHEISAAVGSSGTLLAFDRNPLNNDQGILLTEAHVTGLLPSNEEDEQHAKEQEEHESTQEDREGRGARPKGYLKMARKSPPQDVTIDGHLKEKDQHGW